MLSNSDTLVILGTFCYNIYLNIEFIGYKMGYINSKKYGTAVQLYKKVNGDISYYITFKDEDNILKRIKIGDKSKGITEPFCNHKRNEVIHSIKLGTDVPIKYKKKKEIEFDQIANKYFEELEIYSKSQTLKDVKSKYNTHIKPYIGNVPIDMVLVEYLEQIQRDKVKILATKTVNMLIDLVGTIYNLAIKKELCNHVNPASRVKRFKVNNIRERYLITEEIQELFDSVKESKLLTLFLKLALTTGGRLDTILHIQKKDIDISTNTITLHDLKNKDTYKGFLTDDVKEILKPNLYKLKANDYIIGMSSTKYTTRQLQSRLKPKVDKLFNKELDIGDRKNRVVIHTLRHTFASHLAINNTPIFTIQKLMNHKDIKQTMRYAKLAPDSGREFVINLYN